MKCSDCGQEIIDNKTFCPNCGKQLKKIEKEVGKNRKTFLIFIVVMLLLGGGTMYMIGNVGTTEELKKITDKNKKEEIEDFYNQYIIKDILVDSNTKEEIKNEKDNIIGYELELSKEKFKLGLFKINWISINKPTVLKVKDITKHKENLNITNEKINVISIEGLNVYDNKTERELSYMISVDSKLYLYYMDTYFELETSKLGFKSVDTYYKVKLPELKYASSINKLLKDHNEIVKNVVEKGTHSVYENYTKEYKDNDITHLVFYELDGGVNAGFSTSIKTLSFNDKGERLNLKEYVEHINKNYEEIIEKYRVLQEELLKDDSTLVKSEINPNLMYYVKENTLYILAGNNDWGMSFVEIKLGE